MNTFDINQGKGSPNKVQNDSGNPMANLDIASLPDVICESCDNDSFMPAMLMKKVSALLSESGKPGYFPINVFACTKCGHVNKEFNPLSKL